MHLIGKTQSGIDEAAMVDAQRRAAAAEALLRAAIESISGGFLICDQEDRLVLFNEHFRRSFEGCDDILRAGVRYEDFLREAVRRGCYPRAAGCEDAWCSERLAQHRAANTEIAVLLRGDRWGPSDRPTYEQWRHCNDKRRYYSAQISSKGTDRA